METKSRPLSYSAYINDRAIVESLRIPQPAPTGQTAESWPMWHVPGTRGAPDSIEWTPGDSWPRGAPWSHHEVIFIRTHQAFEVWFAVILHELGEILRQARERCEVQRAKIDTILLDERKHDGREFSPRRFPGLSAVATSFHNSTIRNRIELMPTPGRYSSPSAALDFPPEALREWSAALRRATSAFLVTIPFFDVLSTMVPKQFLEFRGRLAPASGFGSTQFREIEMLLGLRELSRPRIMPTGGTSGPESTGEPLPPPMLRPTKDTPPHQQATCFYSHHLPSDWPLLARRFREPSLRDLVYALLNGNIFEWASPAQVDEAIDNFAALNVRETIKPYDRPKYFDEIRVCDHIDGLGEFLSHRETIVAALLEMKSLDDEPSVLRSFMDACLEMDGALLRWRDQHIRFVEKMIGRRPGTGGTGVNYLRTTTDAGLATYVTHAFPCLWQAKSLVQAEPADKALLMPR